MTTTSEKQAAANRANATRSTGPRSAAGKARSARNARKHGLSSATFSIIRLEDQNELDNLKADAVASYRPQTPQEDIAVERIAICQLAIHRGYRLEAGMFIQCLNIALNDDHATPIYKMHSELIEDRKQRVEQNRNYALSEGFRVMVKGGNEWTLLLRYQAQADRQYRRAVEDFERLKRLRKEIPNEPISDPGPEETESDPPAENEPIAGPEPDDACASPQPLDHVPCQPPCEPEMTALDCPAEPGSPPPSGKMELPPQKH
jgi:hypothetical protein